MAHRSSTYLASLIITSMLSPFSIAFAQEGDPTQSFSDLPPEHYAFRSVEFLKSEGVISGYDDGTFRPGDGVNRAAAVKLAVAPLMSESDLTDYEPVLFDDTPADAWFVPYLSYAVKNNIIDGPSKKSTFRPGDPVTKSEYFKILMLAQNVDPNSFSDVTRALSTDVNDSNQWFYPYMRYGIASSMTIISTNGTLDPGRQLSRGDTALILFRLLMYRNKRRVQALLGAAENEIQIILQLISNNNIEQAEYASARSVLAVRGALASREDLPVVKGAVKIVESFDYLVQGYRAGLDLNFEGSIDLAKKSWSLAEESKQFTQDLGELPDQVQEIAASMAEDARTMIQKIEDQEIPALPQVLD